MSEWRRAAEVLRDRLVDQFPRIQPGPDLVGPIVDEDRDAALRSAGRLALCRASLRPALFDYQRDLSAEVTDVFRSRGTGLLALPTGAGKTRTAIAGLLGAYADAYVSRTVWLAPSVELVDQACSTFERVWREFGSAPDMALERGREPPVGSNVIWLSTPQAIYARAKRRRDVGRWDAVVFDEAHQLGARTFRSAVASLRSVAGTALVGLSATPGRLDPDETEDLVDLFEEKLLRSSRLAPNPIRALQRRGVLARLDFRTLETPRPGGVVERMIEAASVVQKVVSASGRVLVFAGNVPEGIVFGEALTAIGVPARTLHSKHSEAQRRSILQSFERGDIRALVNHRLLATGYDCPGVTDLILLSRIGSPILFEQIVGRAARGPRTGGSSTAVVWEFDGHLAIHGLPKSYYRYQEFDWR